MLAELPSEALRGKAAAMLYRATVSSARPTAKVEVDSEPLAALPAGDSLEQREAEAVLLASLSALLECDLAPSRVHLPDGAWVELDGLCNDPPVLAEVWAHQGQTKPAQRNKVLADALKLLHVAAQLPVPYRKVLCLSDEQAARPFLGRSWYASALRSLAIEVLVVPLDDATRERVAAAQRRQYR